MSYQFHDLSFLHLFGTFMSCKCFLAVGYMADKIEIINIIHIYNSNGCCLICIKYIVGKLRFLSMHKITVKANFTVSKFNLLFHEYTIL